MSNDIFSNSDRLSGFMYFFSGLHFLHVLGGIPFLIYHYIKIKNLNRPLLLLSDNESAELNFKILRTYWHFLDLLWIYLIVFLSVMIYIF